jgi:hypothetical protein
MLCHRGCGLEEQYRNKKGLPCCSKVTQHCQTVKDKIGAKNKVSLTGRKLSEAHRNKISKGLIDRNYSHSPESIEKIKKGNIVTKSTQDIVPWNKNKKGLQVAWNKGLRKQESFEIISRTDPVYADFRKYRNRIAVRTKKTYMIFKEEINPYNLPLGKCGIDGAHQIDHILTVRQGFEQGVSIEEMSAKENLQVIPWLDNVKKYDGKGLRK